MFANIRPHMNGEKAAQDLPMAYNLAGIDVLYNSRTNEVTLVTTKKCR